MVKKQLYNVLNSANYSASIHIPITLNRVCSAFCLYNKGDVEVNVTVKGITIPIPSGCTSGMVTFDRDLFGSLVLDTSLGHDFILELYRD